MEMITIEDRNAALAGDDVSAMKMINKLRPYAVKRMSTYVRRDLHGDAWQEIQIRLLIAIGRWDPNRGSWLTFASRQVCGAIGDFLRTVSKVKGYGRSAYKNTEVPGVFAESIVSKPGGPTVTELARDNIDPIEQIDWSDVAEHLRGCDQRLRAVGAYFLECGNMKRAASKLGVSESRCSQILASLDAGDRRRIAKAIGMEVEVAMADEEPSTICV